MALPGLTRAAEVDRLYRQWWPVVVDFSARRLGNLEEAEVVAQEALLRALDIAAREPVGSFAALVLRIASNLASDRRRRSDWRHGRGDLAEVPSDAVPETSDVARIRAAVAALEAREREVVELRYDDGLSFAQIAVRLGMSKNGVFARHERAIASIRTWLQRRGR